MSTTPPHLRWVFYHDLFDRMRWQVVDSRGTLIASSSDSFASEAACECDARAHGCCVGSTEPAEQQGLGPRS